MSTTEAEAREWYRSVGQLYRGGRPQEARRALLEAERAGIDPDALEAVTVRVRRRRGGAEYLALPGTFRRRDYIQTRREE